MNTTEESKERILSNHFFSVKNLTMDGMWVVLLFISGLFKIPSPIPGTEFQLSAPLAISIGRIRGFLHYLTIGIIASIIGMILGLQTIYNVIIAMVYRIVAGLILTVLKRTHWPSLLLVLPERLQPDWYWQQSWVLPGSL
mgnify:CR=1 FL=1